MARERTWHNLVWKHKDGFGVLEISQINGDKCFVHYFDIGYFDYVASRHWSVYGNGNGTYGHYARTSGGARGKYVILHRLPFIDDIKPGQVVDHKSRNTFNSMTSNLRVTSRRQNQLNRRSAADIPNLGHEKRRGFEVWRPNVIINSKKMFSPAIREYELAKNIAEIYREIGALFDEGCILEPTRDQMMEIVQCIKNNVDDPIGQVFEVASNENV